jgi:hypothetical protein
MIHGRVVTIGINGADEKIYELGGSSEVLLEPFFSH